MLELAYQGTHYHGWQRQPHSDSVQQTIEEKLSLILRQPIEIMGCGRTDTGVHASCYFAHFDFEGGFPPAFVARLNKFLPDDIAIQALYRTDSDTHARFDATHRAYRYDISAVKDPFRIHTITHYPQLATLDRELVQATAELLLGYEDFAPFCKTNSDARTQRCDLRRSEWAFGERQWSFYIEADRFLRGMVRLVVGACLRVGKGQLELEEVARALDQQRAMQGAWSAPAAGLFLTRIDFPQKSTWELLF